MPKGKRKRIYNRVMDVAFQLELVSVDKDGLYIVSSNDGKRIIHSTSKDMIFIKKADVFPLFKIKVFSIMNFCRLFNLEPTLLQRYFINPGIYQVELQYLKLILDSLPNLSNIHYNTDDLYARIKTKYGSILYFCKYHNINRQTLYRMFAHQVNFNNYRTFRRYLSILNILNISPYNATEKEKLMISKIDSLFGIYHKKNRILFTNKDKPLSEDMNKTKKPKKNIVLSKKTNRITKKI